MRKFYRFNPEQNSKPKRWQPDFIQPKRLLPRRWLYICLPVILIGLMYSGLLVADSLYPHKWQNLVPVSADVFFSFKVDENQEDLSLLKSLLNRSPGGNLLWQYQVASLPFQENLLLFDDYHNLFRQVNLVQFEEDYLLFMEFKPHKKPANKPNLLDFLALQSSESEYFYYQFIGPYLVTSSNQVLLEKTSSLAKIQRFASLDRWLNFSSLKAHREQSKVYRTEIDFNKTPFHVFGLQELPFTKQVIEQNIEALLVPNQVIGNYPVETLLRQLIFDIYQETNGLSFEAQADDILISFGHNDRQSLDFFEQNLDLDYFIFNNDVGENQSFRNFLADQFGQKDNHLAEILNTDTIIAGRGGNHTEQDFIVFKKAVDQSPERLGASVADILSLTFSDPFFTTIEGMAVISSSQTFAEEQIKTWANKLIFDPSLLTGNQVWVNRSNYFASADEDSDLLMAAGTLTEILPQSLLTFNTSLSKASLAIRTKEIPAYRKANAQRILDRLDRVKDQQTVLSSPGVRDSARLADLLIFQDAFNGFIGSTGRAPADLSELRPEYLAQIPTDPLDQEWYQYSNVASNRTYYLKITTEGETRLGPAGNYCFTGTGLEFAGHNSCQEK